MYNNSYNSKLISKLNKINKDKIEHEKKINNNAVDPSLNSRLESMVMRNKNLHGGSGYVASTLHDQGYSIDQMKGLGSDQMERTEGCGLSAGGLSAGGLSAGGLSAGSKKRKAKKQTEIGGAILGLADVDIPKGNPPPTGPMIRAGPQADAFDHPIEQKIVTKDNMKGVRVGSGKKVKSKSERKPSARNELIKTIMKEKNLSLPAASKYIKDHNLY